MLEREIFNSLFPDTPYGVESGGDPSCIPDLTYEEFLDFHRKYYHPSNSYIYLYGNMNMEEYLAWMDEKYLCAFEEIPVESRIPMQKPFDAPGSCGFRIRCWRMRRRRTIRISPAIWWSEQRWMCICVWHFQFLSMFFWMRRELL